MEEYRFCVCFHFVVEWFGFGWNLFKCKFLIFRCLKARTYGGTTSNNWSQKPKYLCRRDNRVVIQRIITWKRHVHVPRISDYKRFQSELEIELPVRRHTHSITDTEKHLNFLCFHSYFVREIENYKNKYELSRKS